MPFINNFFDLFLESAPWLILGFFIAGLIKSFVPSDLLNRHLGGRNYWTTFKAAFIGAPLPLCSCGVVPVALGLRKSGASKNATVAFLVATPETGVDSVSVTYALLGPVMAVVRPIAAICSGVLAGLLVGRAEEFDLESDSHNSKSQLKGEVKSCCSAKVEAPQAIKSGCCSKAVQASIEDEGSQQAAQPSSGCCSKKAKTGELLEKTPAKSCCSSKTPKAAAKAELGQRLIEGLQFSFGKMLRDIALWLMIGLLFAAAVLTWVPVSLLQEWGSGWSAFIIMSLIGVPMYICATASTPIAAGLLIAGLSPGAVLVFMMAGPATNIGTMGIIYRELGKRSLTAYLAGVLITAFSFGYLLNILAELYSWDLASEAKLGHEMGFGWVDYSAGVILAVFLLKAFSALWQERRAKA